MFLHYDVNIYTHDCMWMFIYVCVYIAVYALFLHVDVYLSTRCICECAYVCMECANRYGTSRCSCMYENV